MPQHGHVFLNHTTTAATALACAAWVNVQIRPTGTCSLVARIGCKLVPRGSGNTFCQAVVLDHPCDVQVFQHNNPKLMHQAAAELVGGVRAAARRERRSSRPGPSGLSPSGRSPSRDEGSRQGSPRAVRNPFVDVCHHLAPFAAFGRSLFQFRMLVFPDGKEGVGVIQSDCFLTFFPRLFAVGKCFVVHPTTTTAQSFALLRRRA